MPFTNYHFRKQILLAQSQFPSLSTSAQFHSSYLVCYIWTCSMSFMVCRNAAQGKALPRTCWEGCLNLPLIVSCLYQTFPIVPARNFHNINCYMNPLFNTPLVPHGTHPLILVQLPIVLIPAWCFQYLFVH